MPPFPALSLCGAVLAWGLGLLLGASVRAEETSVVPVASTASCDRFPQVTCTSTNAGVVSDVLQLASDTRDNLTSILNLRGPWRFPVHVRILTPDDPLTGKMADHALRVAIADKSLQIEAAVTLGDPDAREFVQRQFVTALLWEKFFPPDQVFTTDTRLDVIPLWLVEGLRETLEGDPEHDRAAVVRRAALAGRAPKLAEVTAWNALDGDRLRGLWQRSFCYYLVNSLVRRGPPRENFQAWLNDVACNNTASARTLFPTEVAWQKELLAATKRSRDIVYTWDETLGELTAAQSLVLPSASGTPADDRICTLDTLAGVPMNPKTAPVLESKVRDLLGLELRAHPSWRPIIASYRFALNAQAAGHPDQARTFIAQAQEARTRELAAHGKLVDYVNWFEVTHDFGGTSSGFRDYFTTAHQLEQAQADPAHPNPIRASVLHVEAEL